MGLTGMGNVFFFRAMELENFYPDPTFFLYSIHRIHSSIHPSIAHRCGMRQEIHIYNDYNNDERYQKREDRKTAGKNVEGNFFFFFFWKWVTDGRSCYIWEKCIKYRRVLVYVFHI